MARAPRQTGDAEPAVEVRPRTPVLRGIFAAAGAEYRAMLPRMLAEIGAVLDRDPALGAVEHATHPLEES